jgi:DNA-binding NarL/FixJ family response regulator
VIRVLLVDDHRVVLAGLASLVDGEPDMQVVATAAGAETAVDLARRCAPDVVLMDLSMPGTDGVAAIAQVLEVRPQAQVLVLTSFSDRERITRAVHAGAVGYLLKDAVPDELLQGIRAAARGESPLDPRVARALLADEAPPGPAARALSDRDRALLHLLAEGLPNREIAARLQISEKTVKNNLSRVFGQIGVTDRTSAALWAHRNLPAAP